MTKITITLDDEEIEVLEKRAKKNIFSLTEQVEDIIRRSCVNSSKKTTVPKVNCDDKLVGIFSRQKTGKQPKKKEKKKKAKRKKKK